MEILDEGALEKLLEIPEKFKREKNLEENV